MKEDDILKKITVKKNILDESTIKEIKRKNQYVKNVFQAILPGGFFLDVDIYPKKPRSFFGLMILLYAGEGLSYKYLLYQEGAWHEDSDNKFPDGLLVQIKRIFEDYILPENGLEKFNIDAYKKYIFHRGKLFTYDGNYLICRDKDNKSEIFRKKFDRIIKRIESSPLKNGIIILFSDDSNQSDTTLLGLFDEEGNNIWYAENIYDDMVETYTEFSIGNNELFGHSFDSHLRRIDLKTGKVIDSEFTK